MNFTIDPHTLAAQAVPQLLVAQRDAALVSSAANACVTLRLLTASLTEADLVRRAIDRPDGLPWLDAIAEDAGVLIGTLRNERAHAKAVLTADAAERNKLDSAAVDRLGRAEAAIRRHQAAVRDAADRFTDVSQALASAGMPESEVAAYVAARQAESIAAATASLEADQIIVASIIGFLADPLRDTAHLGVDLAHELAELAEASAAVAAGGISGIDLSSKARE